MRVFGKDTRSYDKALVEILGDCRGIFWRGGRKEKVNEMRPKFPQRTFKEVKELRIDSNRGEWLCQVV